LNGAIVPLVLTAQSAAVSGHVLDAATGQPVAGAVVVATEADKQAAQRFLTTDQKGEYQFRDLPAGTYSIRASAVDYVARSFGQRHALDEGVPLRLRSGEVRADVSFSLRRGGAIAGRVRGANGAPCEAAEVEALRPQLVGELSILVPIGGAQTDADGRFRIDGLPAGSYYVGAFDPVHDVVDSAGQLTWAHTYYPGVWAVSEAKRVTIESGQVMPDLEFAIRRTTRVRLSGRLAGPDRGQLRSASVVLRSAFDDAMTTVSVSVAAVVKPDGSFAFVNVPPGRYQLRAQAIATGENRQLFATFAVAIEGRDVGNVLMNLGPGARISGRLQVETGAQLSPDDVGRVWATAPSSDTSSAAGLTKTLVGRDGTFVLDTPAGPRLIRLEGLPDSWSLHRVTWRGQDITDTPLDLDPGEEVRDVSLLLTNRASRLAGAVRDGRGLAVTDHAIVTVPVNPLLRRSAGRHVRLVYPGLDGRYEISGLPAGNYLVTAAEELLDGDLHGPGVLERIAARGTEVTVRAGVTTTLDLTVRP
jgi:5-hydroxyisourate hydrolase-like protein (transthyretin family)